MHLDRILDWSGTRAVVRAVAYVVALLVCHWLAYQLRFDFYVSTAHTVGDVFGICLSVSMAIQLLALLFFGQFSVLMGYFSVPDLRQLLLATGVAMLLQIAGTMSIGSPFFNPRGVILINFVLTTVALGGVRLGFRELAAWRRARRKAAEFGVPVDSKIRRVAIFGAGDVGAQLAKELLSLGSLRMEPVAFFDDNKEKWNHFVHGVKVYGAPDKLPKIAKDLRIASAIIAMPSASGRRIKELAEMLLAAGIKSETVPSYVQLMTGEVKVTQLKPVEIQDLLGREQVQLDLEQIKDLIAGKVVMVTGAGGSIGSELCRQILVRKPSRLLLVEQSEVQLFQIEQELLRKNSDGVVEPLIADVLDLERMESIFSRFRPALVFHAAAHKHVPMMEMQPSEAIKNNAFGTAQVAELAARHKAERFVLISTDKAINPTNVMGATKRVAELVLQAMHSANGSVTRFNAVRFGNVLGSSGSVVPTFTRQIAEGGPITVTHPDVERYFMTIPEAVSLVLQCATLGTGGEIFVLDMGKPVKIADLARQMIELSGLRLGVDIEIKFTGLRPGEKLFEELQHKGENHHTTKHPRIMRFVSAPPSLQQIQKEMDALRADIHSVTAVELKSRLKSIVPEYTPYAPVENEKE